MTIAKALEDVLAECGIDNPNPSINGADFEMRQMKSLMKAAGEDIASRTEWAGAIREMQISMGQTEVPLPDDFREMTEAGSVSLAVSGTQLRAIVDPGMWSFLRSATSEQIYYHLSGGNVLFSRSLPEDVRLGYVSKAWLREGLLKITSDDDEPIFPTELLARGAIWRWKRQKGLNYDDIHAEFEADLEAYIKADRGIQ